MNFYKFICVLAFIVLIVSLACIGVAIHTSSNDVLFPPNVSSCPDFYIKNSNGQCEATFNVPSGCDTQTFDETNGQYSNPGMGPTSGMCSKKNWAEECGVNWDGITNNTEICYATNSSS